MSPESSNEDDGQEQAGPLSRFRKKRARLSPKKVVPHAHKIFAAQEFQKRQQGQTLTEFAMVLPLLALLLFAVIQFGIVFHQYVTLTDAVRAGGRQGAVSRDVSNPQGSVINRVRTSAADLDQAKLGVTVSSTWVQGSDVPVSSRPTPTTSASSASS